jgi:cobalamin biosynthetic protein CobC
MSGVAPSSLAYHGGRLDAAAARFPDAPEPWLDLSTGINPYAWDGAAPAPDLRALPCPSALARLEAAAARAFGAEALATAALPGSEIGLRALVTLDPPRPWRVVAPAYRTHEAALPGAARIAIGAIAREAERGGTILLANPNNPDGRLLPPADLLALGRALAARGGLLIVDEAFADAVPGASVLPALAPDDRVLAFRSFGKMYGLAGVRLGFACGARDPVAAIAGRLGSWPVSATAIAIGTAAYADARWIADTRERLRIAAADLDRVLRAHGLVAQGRCPLFRLVETPDAPALFERLGRAGILVRPFEERPTWLRFGLPPGDALARLDAALG